MSSGIEINMLMNSRDVQRGAKDVEKALSEVADSLDDVARDAERAGDGVADGLGDGAKQGASKAERAVDEVSDAMRDVARDAGRAGREIGDGVSDGARDGERSVDRLERSFHDMVGDATRGADDVGDALSKAGDKGKDLSDGVREGARGASEATAEFKEEAVANLSETVSSFRGDAEDIAQIAQDTLGGVVGALGPVGMAAGVAGAAGIGLIMGALEEGKEEAQEMRDRVGELTGDLIDIGGDPVAAVEQLADGIKELATESEEGKQNLAQLRADAEGSVSGFRKLADAYAGNTDGLKKMVKAEREHLEAAQEAVNFDKRWDASTTSRLIKARDGQERIVEGLEDAYAAAKQAEAGEEAWLKSNGPAYEAKAEQIDALQGELDSAGDAYADFHDAETGATDVSGYLSAMQARIDATSNFAANVQELAATTGLSMQEAQWVLDQGVDFAPVLADIMEGGTAAQEKYAGLVQQIVGGGQEIADGNPLTIRAESDTESARADLNQATSEKREAEIGAEANTRRADADLNRTAAKRRVANITARAYTNTASGMLERAARARTAWIRAQASTGAAESQLAYLARPRTTIITADVRTREGKRV